MTSLKWSSSYGSRASDSDFINLAYAADFGSVTVLAQDALTADALSTGLFVLGPEAGLELDERLKGVEAIFIEATTPERRVRVSEGLRHRTRLLSSGVASFPSPAPVDQAISAD